MIDKIFEYIVLNYAEWFVLCMFSLFAIGYRRLMKAIGEDRKKNKAVAQGVEALLRDRIIDSFHKYEKTGICPIYAKENVKRMYIPYHELGGNDIATELVEKLLDMKTVETTKDVKTSV